MKRSKTVGDLACLGEYERRKQLWARRRAQGGSLAALAGSPPQQQPAVVVAARAPTLLKSSHRPLPLAGGRSGPRRTNSGSSRSSSNDGKDHSPPLVPLLGAPATLRPSVSEPLSLLPDSLLCQPPSSTHSSSSATLLAVFSGLHIAAQASSDSLATTAVGRRLSDAEAALSSLASSVTSSRQQSPRPLTPRNKRRSEEELPDIDVLLQEEEDEDWAAPLRRRQWEQEEDGGASPGAGWSHIVDPAELAPPPLLHEEEEEGDECDATDEEGDGQEGGAWLCPFPPMPPSMPTLGREGQEGDGPEMIVESGGGGGKGVSATCALPLLNGRGKAAVAVACQWGGSVRHKQSPQQV